MTCLLIFSVVTLCFSFKLDESVLIVEFQFILPNAHPNRYVGAEKRYTEHLGREEKPLK